jgi:hypothetical protein
MFSFAPEIRRAIYTTNTIESLNMTLRKIIKNRAMFPSDEAVFKILYLALKNISKKWTMPIHDWSGAMNQFAILFENRLPNSSFTNSSFTKFLTRSSCQKKFKMLFELRVSFVMITLDGCFFDRSIHSLDLTICPWMLDFHQTVFDSVPVTNAIKQVYKRPFIFLAIGKLDSVVSQNRVNVIRDDHNQLS